MLQILTSSNTYSVLTPHMCTVASTPPAVNTYFPSWLATRLTTCNARKNVSLTCLNIGGQFDKTLIHRGLAMTWSQWHRTRSTLAQVMAWYRQAPMSTY